MKYVTCVLGDRELAALRAIRSVIADSNHPDKAGLIAAVSRMDGSAQDASTGPQAYRMSWVANPGFEISVAPNERIALRLVRMGHGSESLITHQILDCPVPAGVDHEVLGYAVTTIIRSDATAGEQTAAWLNHERVLLGGGQ